MKYVVLIIISFYQLIISPFLHAVTGSSTGCRYQPTCSQYAKEVIKKYGLKKGLSLAFKRIATCHPFSRV